MSTIRHVIGCMSGTSLDGIDAALVRIEGTGLGMRASFVRGLSAPLGESADDLRRLATGEALTARQIAGANLALSEAHAKAILEISQDTQINCVSVHGQTVFHQPPLTWQLIDASLIRVRTELDVVCNLRSADVASGGEGAPITPIADSILFRDVLERLSVVNLGGFVNATLLGDLGTSDTRSVDGFDVCVCNQALDSVAKKRLGLPFDSDGKVAAGAVVDEQLKAEFIAEMARAQRDGESLGTGDEVLSTLAKDSTINLKPGVVLRSLCAAVAHTITASLAAFAPQRVALAGGGTMNATLVAEIKAAIESTLGAECDVSDPFGVPAVYREAMAMGVLGALCADRVPITLHATTGGTAPITGEWSMG